MTDEMYSPEDKTTFQRVGEFLCWFSMLETNIDESIIRVLGIEAVAGRLLLSYVPFRRKCDFLRKLTELSQLEFTPDDRRHAKDALGRIQALHDTRNIVAHSHFLSEAGAVRFLKAEKKLSTDTSKRIDEEAFDQYRSEMAELWGKIAQIAQRIQNKMDQRQVAEAMARARFEEELAPFSKTPLIVGDL